MSINRYALKYFIHIGAAYNVDYLGAGLGDLMSGDATRRDIINLMLRHSQ